MSRAKVGAVSIEALEELYRDRYGRFLRLALAMTGSRDAAADAVQEAFARALRYRHEIRGDDALEAWIYRIVINASRTHRKKRRRSIQLEDGWEESISANGSRSASPWPELRAAIAALPERQRHALFLRHYADLDYERIGEVLGIARGTVAATLHAAHESLRATLEGVRT